MSNNEIRVVTVHGIHSDGAGSTDLMGRALAARGWRWREYDYGEITALGARFGRKKRARDLMAMANGCHVIGHSNGGRVILDAMELGAHFRTVILFAPAASHDDPIPVDGCERLIVVHNPHDEALAMGDLLVAHPFGVLGKVGYQGPPDPRVTNVLDDNVMSGDPLHHTGPYFGPCCLDRCVVHVNRWLRGEA